jgi:hypothetical protein
MVRYFKQTLDWLGTLLVIAAAAVLLWRSLLNPELSKANSGKCTIGSSPIAWHYTRLD